MTSERISGAARIAGASILGLALLSACGGGGSTGATPAVVATTVPTTNPSGQPTTVPTTVPVGACTDGTNATLTLISPAAGSTGNATGAQAILVQASAPIPATVEFELIDKNGTTQLGGQITGSNPYTAAGFTLVSGDTYNVYLLNTAQSGCTAQAIANATFST